MIRRRWALMGGLLLCLGVLSLSAGDPGMCRANCNNQYTATVKYCTGVLARDASKRAWYNDCVKNARIFRDECLRRCR